MSLSTPASEPPARPRATAAPHLEPTAGRPARPVQPDNPQSQASAQAPAITGDQRGEALGAPVSDEQIRSGLIGEDAEEAARLEEQLRRRLADAELVAELAASDFAGPAWEVFVDDLVRYALSVMGGWLLTGFIFKLAKNRGFGLHVSSALLDQLATDKDLRKDLAAVTVAAALPRFREKALVGGQWDPDKGAGVTTYFMGACVFAFPNELRRHRSQQERWGRADAQHRRIDTQAYYDLDHGPITDPGTIAASDDRVREALARAKPRERAIVAATIAGYTQEEIVEILGETSVRAIEGVLHRWRGPEADRIRRGVN